jgi:hypothetical protein
LRRGVMVAGRLVAQRANTRSRGTCTGGRTLTTSEPHPYVSPVAQVAELVDALVSGTSGESRGGSSPLLGTKPPESFSPPYAPVARNQFGLRSAAAARLIGLAADATSAAAARRFRSTNQR